MWDFRTHNTGPTDRWIDEAGKTGYLLEYIPFLGAHRKTNINVGVIISCKITRHKRKKKSRERDGEKSLPRQDSPFRNHN